LLAWTVSASVLIYRLRRDRYLEPLSELRLDELLRTWRSHLTISGPAAAANMLTPVATGIITAVLAGYGTAAVAAYGVSIRMESLALIVILALSASLPPFISQNFGAGRLDRVRDALRRVIIFTLLWQALVYLVMLPFVPRIAVIFTGDAGVADVLATILYVLPLSYGCQGVIVLCNSSLNALHEPRRALALSLLRWGAFYVPGALVGVALAGVPGLIVGAALGNVAGAVLAALWIWRRAAENGAVLAPG
ncbi:MAG: MATE family efflux transporter, partial [Gammaproteobacteria bacterium]|nr:MATE family efflux transporter [Gammaproteobacteria bacterium]